MSADRSKAGGGPSVHLHTPIAHEPTPKAAVQAEIIELKTKILEVEREQQGLKRTLEEVEVALGKGRSQSDMMTQVRLGRVQQHVLSTLAPPIFRPTKHLSVLCSQTGEHLSRRRCLCSPAMAGRLRCTRQ